jgi:hypothetical protein
MSAKRTSRIISKSHKQMPESSEAVQLSNAWIFCPDALDLLVTTAVKMPSVFPLFDADLIQDRNDSDAISRVCFAP